MTEGNGRAQIPAEVVESVVMGRPDPKEDFRPWSDRELGEIGRAGFESRYGELFEESRRLAEGYIKGQPWINI